MELIQFSLASSRDAALAFRTVSIDTLLISLMLLLMKEVDEVMV